MLDAACRLFLCLCVPLDFLFVPYKGQHNLKLLVKKKVTNHLVNWGEDGLLTVNERKTDAKTLPEVMEFLSKKPSWWPVPIKDGVSSKAHVDDITAHPCYHELESAADIKGKQGFQWLYLFPFSYPTMQRGLRKQECRKVATSSAL